MLFSPHINSSLSRSYFWSMLRKFILIKLKVFRNGLQRILENVKKYQMHCVWLLNTFSPLKLSSASFVFWPQRICAAVLAHMRCICAGASAYALELQRICVGSNAYALAPTHMRWLQRICVAAPAHMRCSSSAYAPHMQRICAGAPAHMRWRQPEICKNLFLRR